MRKNIRAGKVYAAHEYKVLAKQKRKEKEKHKQKNEEERAKRHVVNYILSGVEGKETKAVKANVSFKNVWGWRK